MKAIEIISIPVTDQEAAKQHYLKLGFKVLAEFPYDKGKWIQLAFDGQENVTITLTTWFPELKPGAIRGFVIKTDSLESDIKKLTGDGVQVGQIENTPWGRFAQVKDPDGNAMSLHES